MRISIILLLPIGIAVIGLAVLIVVLAANGLGKNRKTPEVRQGNATGKKTLGETIKEHRTKCNMTQEFVAERLGVSRQAVSKWESGITEPSTSNLLALAKLFEVSAEELLTKI